MWRLAEHLAATGHHVTAPDLRGSGRSPGAASYAVDDLAGDVRAIGRGWDIVVGHSWGGAVAATLLADDGFARSGLLLDPVIHLPEDAKADVRTALQAEVGGALTMEALRQANPTWDEDDRRRLVAASATVTAEVVARAVADTTPWDLRPLARRWQVPVVVLAADPRLDAFVDESLARDLAENPMTTVRVVPGADHSVHRAAPDVVLAALDELVRSRG